MIHANTDKNGDTSTEVFGNGLNLMHELYAIVKALTEVGISHEAIFDYVVQGVTDGERNIEASDNPTLTAETHMDEDTFKKVFGDLFDGTDN